MFAATYATDVVYYFCVSVESPCPMYIGTPLNREYPHTLLLVRTHTDFELISLLRSPPQRQVRKCAERGGPGGKTLEPSV